MALAVLKTEKLESSEPKNESSNFLTNAIRNIFKRQEKEIEYNDSLQQISLDEVAKHDCYDDCWIIIYDRVYDITEFLHQVSKFFNLVSVIKENVPEEVKKSSNEFTFFLCHS